MQKTYAEYDVVEFALDEAFITHFFLPTRQTTAFWDTFLTENPVKKKEWQEACKLLEIVQTGNITYVSKILSQEEIDLLFHRISKTIRQKQRKQRQLKYGIAASVGILFLLGGFAWLQSDYFSPFTIFGLTKNDTPATEYVGAKSGLRSVRLPDSSTVVLYENSKIVYQQLSDEPNRVVYLSGKAFFSVKRNPELPFIVITENLVTRVLGTSFTIDAYQKSNMNSVQVKTGEVSVFEKKNEADIKKVIKNKISGIVLSPNQQVIFEKNRKVLVKSIVPEPQIIPNARRSLSFQYENIPVSNILADIEEAYGVHIIYDKHSLQNCTLTASLKEESLEDKLKLICLSIGATYEMLDGQIIIYAKTCF